jgi:glycine/D-amino acid oxidase-like deaminating enzyme/nitrite reductase/ring-hydroxylating ferredoxin subunit
MEAIRRIEAIVRREHIDCDFQRVNGYLLHPDADDLLDRELAAALRAGLDASIVERMSWAPFDTGRCLRVANQAQFHPLRYVHGISQAMARMGGPRLHGDARATGRGWIAGTGARRALRDHRGSRRDCHARSDRCGTVPAGPSDRLHVVRDRGTGPGGHDPPRLYWDTETPYHRARLHRTRGDDGRSRGGELLIVGGEDHPVGERDDSIDHYARLEHRARQRFPGMGPVAFTWSGRVLESRDGLGLIGPDPGEHGSVFIVTGDSVTGMTNATIAGMLITDLIGGRPNPWTALYDPGRRALHTVRPGAVRSEGRVALPEPRSEDDIPEDHGAMVHRNGERLAVYRDGQGSVHRFLATCPHQGCQVHWNRVERTWDCSCRGSRFDRFGMVTRGPATVDLEPR